jgi:hypothetical protein
LFRRFVSSGQIQNWQLLNQWNDPHWTLTPGCIYIINYCNPSKGNVALKLFNGTCTFVHSAQCGRLYYPDPSHLLPLYNLNGCKLSSAELVDQIQMILGSQALIVMPEQMIEGKGQFQLVPFRTGIFRWIQNYHWNFCPLVVCPPTFSSSGAVFTTRFAFWQGPIQPWNSELTIERVHQWIQSRLAWFERWSVS